MDFFNKPGEPEEEGTALQAELLSTGAFATCSSIGTGSASLQKTAGYLYLPLISLLSLLSPQYSLPWALCPLPVIKYMHEYIPFRPRLMLFGGLVYKRYKAS